MLRIARLLATGLLLVASASAALASPPEWVVYLKDGRVLRGEIVDRDAERLTMVVSKTGERVTFEETLLRKAEGPPLPPRCVAGDGRVLAATLADGRVVTGALARRCEGGFTLAVEGAEPVQVRDDQVRSVVTTGPTTGPAGGAPVAEAVGALPPAPRPPPMPWRTDVASTRLLASPTGMLPRPGHVTLSSAAFTLGLEAGLTSWLAASAASSVPVGYASDLGSASTVSLAAGHSLGWLHGRAGVLGAFGGSRLTSAHAFAAVTAGRPDLQISAYAGPPLPGAAAEGDFGDRVLSVGGLWRFHAWAAVSTEHWLSLDGSGDTAHALALRLMREPVALEVGALLFPANGNVVPWAGLSWRVWRFE